MMVGCWRTLNVYGEELVTGETRVKSQETEQTSECYGMLSMVCFESGYESALK